MKTALISVTIALSSLVSAANGQGDDKLEIENKIKTVIPKHITKETPGLVVGVVKDGKLIYAKGFGMANLSYNIPNDDQLVYNIGSVSKQFLGYAFAMLHVEGKLDIDDPVSKYVDDWKEFDQKVTLRHLLTHTSGYREAYTMSTLAGRMIGTDRLTRKECLDVVRRQPKLENTPGSKYVYNSTAWVILAEVLEKVTGESASDWVTKHILDPLEMNDTQIEDQVGEVISNSAESYSQSTDGYVNMKSNRAIFGAADIYTNARDMAKWLDNFRTAKVGGKKVQALFLEPFELNDGSSANYGLGIRVRTYRGTKEYSHTGGHEAFVTQLGYYPEHDLGIFTVSNAGGNSSVSIHAIADLLLEKHLTKTVDDEVKSIDLDSKQLQKFTGDYLLLDEGRSHSVNILDGVLTIDGRMRLTPLSDVSFRIMGANARVLFDDENGKMSISTVGQTRVFDRFEPTKLKSDSLKAFEGDYWSEELETVYHLRVKNEKLTINHRWLGEHTLEHVAGNLFRFRFGLIAFKRNKAKETIGFGVSTPRTKNVMFSRIKTFATN